MRIFSTAFGFILLVFVISFALSNKGEVTMWLWPFEGTLESPLYVVGLVPLVFGFFFGCMVGWVNGIPHRMHAKKLGKELSSLNTKLEELQKTALVQHEKVKTKSSFWGG